LAARSKKLPTVLNTLEVQELLKQPNRKCPTGLRNYLVMLLMYRAGLRVSEVINLETKNINWQVGDLKVVDGKGSKDRVVPLETYVLDSLRKWKAERPKGNKFFTTLKGEELNDRYIRTFVKRYAGKANIQKDVHPHTLRHTFATELLDQGFNISEVQDLLGHSDLSTTMIYTHVNPVTLREKIRLRV
jgi:site-specific recombinase XerD